MLNSLKFLETSTKSLMACHEGTFVLGNLKKPCCKDRTEEKLSEGKTKNRSSDDCFDPQGRGPQKVLTFWGRGGAAEQAIDFF